MKPHEISVRVSRESHEWIPKQYSHDDVAMLEPHERLVRTHESSWDRICGPSCGLLMRETRDEHERFISAS